MIAKISLKNRLNNYYIVNNTAYSLFSLSLCKFLYGFYTTAIGSILVPLGERFSINIKMQSIIFPFNYFGQIVIIFFVGYFADKLGKKIVHMIFISLLCIFALLFNFSDNYYLFLILFMLMGLSGISINTIADAAISDTFQKNKGYYLNIAHVFFGLGALTSPIAFNLVFLSTNDYRSIYFILFIIAAVIVFLIIAAKYPVVNDERIRPKVLIGFLKNRQFIYICIFAMISAGSMNAISGWIPTLFQKYLNISPAFSNYALSFFWISVVIGRIITAFLSKKFREISLLRIINVFLFFILAASYFFDSYVWLLIVYLVFGLFVGGSFPLAIAYSAHILPGYSTTRLAAVFSASAMGMFVMPTVVGLLAGHFAMNKIISVIASFFLIYIFIFFKKLK
ncbi:MAG: MFS transporter [Actinobacteria bacterium]|nr:MFS transporter [Actinomycetota bacterium]